MPTPEPGQATRAACCDLHGTHCEPPSELCCEGCGEARHPEHPDGVHCVIDPYGLAAIGRAWGAGYAEVYVAAGVERVRFSDQTFIAWYLAERAQVEREVREQVARAIENEITLLRDDGITPPEVSGLTLAAQVARGET